MIYKYGMIKVMEDDWYNGILQLNYEFQCGGLANWCQSADIGQLVNQQHGIFNSVDTSSVRPNQLIAVAPL